MKKIIYLKIAILQLLAAVAIAQTPTTSQNYVMETSVRVSNKTSAAALVGLTVAEANRNIQYLDGLGRPVQTVQWKASPLQVDIVQPFAYDGYGRQVRKYLPYAEQSSSDASFKSAATSNQSSFYSSGSWDANIVRTAYPFAETVLELSPLNRVLEQGAPGAVWQPAGSRTASSGRTVVQGYATNTSTDAVKQWTVAASSALSGGSYTAGRLFKSVSKDENWTSASGNGGTTEEYKDIEGRIVLKRVWQTGLVALDTYYLYDDLGNLRYVLPPAVTVNSFTESDAVFTNFIYGYHYDSRNRLVEKKVSGKGWEYLVYNLLDQVIFTQDANQRAIYQWTFTKYDAFGRVILTGFYQDNSSRATFQTNVVAIGLPLWESRDNGTATGYTNVSYPNTSITAYLTANFYDDYNVLGMASTYPSTVTVMAAPKALLTAKRIFKSDGTNPVWTFLYYDNEGRVKETMGGNHLSGTDRVINTYNFAGELTASIRTHVANSITTVMAETYTYDHIGRKVSNKMNINGQGEVVLNKLTYNEIGQLKQKQLHSSDGGSTFMQGTKFAYNERGWLKNSASPQFSLKLGYDTLSNPQYNGNISTQLWGSGYTNRYNYLYDGLDRLTSAASTGVAMSEALTYDVMGNIATLSRDGGVASLYFYTGNRLNHVDGVTNPYSYDANGNTTINGRMNLTQTYNYLNQVKHATTTGLNVYLTYDALGNKLRKEILTSGSIITDYVDGVQYNNGTIEFIQTDEGRALNNAGTFTYQYNLSDHLGNVRYSFDIYAGAVRRLQGDDYYAFGLRKSISPVVLDNKYLYNGKELQDELGVYDYGARFYDPIVARWNVVDALASEKLQIDLSPYQYAWNNPVKLIDPDGNCPELPCNGRCGHSISDALGFIGPDISKSIKQLPGQILGFTDVNDATVLVTSVTRGKNAINVDGSKATTLDKVSAAAGVLIPFVSGSALKKIAKNLGSQVVEGVTDVFKNRVKLQKGTKEAIREAAPKIETGQFLDFNTGLPINQGQEVFGHKTGQEWSKYKKDPANAGKSRKEVIKDQNDPNKYQIEDRKSNASHKFEEKPKKH